MSSCKWKRKLSLMSLNCWSWQDLPFGSKRSAFELWPDIIIHKFDNQSTFQCRYRYCAIKLPNNVPVQDVCVCVVCVVCVCGVCGVCVWCVCVCVCACVRACVCVNVKLTCSVSGSKIINRNAKNAQRTWVVCTKTTRSKQLKFPVFSHIFKGKHQLLILGYKLGCNETLFVHESKIKDQR